MQVGKAKVVFIPKDATYACPGCRCIRADTSLTIDSIFYALADHEIPDWRQRNDVSWKTRYQNALEVRYG